MRGQDDSSFSPFLIPRIVGANLRALFSAIISLLLEERSLSGSITYQAKDPQVHLVITIHIIRLIIYELFAIIYVWLLNALSALGSGLWTALLKQDIPPQ
jgi:hypothetical protein